MTENPQIVDRTIGLDPRVPKPFNGAFNPDLGTRKQIQWAELQSCIHAFGAFQVSVHAGPAGSSFDGLAL
jgi:transposase-like protein